MKRVGKAVLVLVIAVVAFFILQLILGNSYIEWFMDSQYSIESARVEQTVNDNGEVQVHETIQYEMRKDFRGLYRHLPRGRYVEISDVQIWVEGAKNHKIEFLKKDNREFEARVWLVPYKSSQQLSPENTKNLTMHVTYNAKGVVELGEDVTQIFRQFWGPEWDAPVNDLTAVFKFPQDFYPDTVYTHPGAAVEKDGLAVNIHIDSLPPFSYGETRLVFDKTPEMKFAAQNDKLTKEGIETEEKKYKRETLFKSLLPLGFYVLMLGLVILTFYFLGREPKIQYQGIYERELPYKDSPDLVNCVVNNLLNSVDNDGMTAVLMDLYKKDYIEFEPGSSKKKDVGQIIVFKKDKPGTDLFDSEKYMFTFLKGYADSENRLDFKALQKTLKKSVSKSKQFNSSYSIYQDRVKSEAKERNMFKTTGYYIATFLAVILGAGGLIIMPLVADKVTPNLLNIAILYSGLCWFTGAVVLAMHKDVFGRWTKEGLEYYRKWENFKKFVSEYSLIKDYPPKSVIVWEEYLVYATALGVADKVEKALKKLIPQEQWERQSNHYYMYGAYGYGLGHHMRTARTTAVQSVSSSSSGSGGGFSGGVGGAGGGSGGGGGGAF